MAMADMRDDELELFFEAARSEAPMPSDELSERVLADALTLMPKASAPVPAKPRGRLAGIFAAIGGWPAVAGLATATVAGVWLGYAQPGGVDSLTDTLLLAENGYDVVDMLPAYDGIWGEG